MDRVNPLGCAIAHGHPHWATGGGLEPGDHLGRETTEGQFGLQVMSIGYGMETATIVERMHN
jgi:acetyl-CoA acyltransferase